MAWRGMTSLAGGLGAWMNRMMFGLMCLLGFWGCYTTIYRCSSPTHCLCLIYPHPRPPLPPLLIMRWAAKVE